MTKLMKAMTAVFAVCATYLANVLLDHFGVANFVTWTVDHVPYSEIIQRQWFRYAAIGVGGLALGVIIGRYGFLSNAYAVIDRQEVKPEANIMELATRLIQLESVVENRVARGRDVSKFESDAGSLLASLEKLDIPVPRRKDDTPDEFVKRVQPFIRQMAPFIRDGNVEEAQDWARKRL